MAVGVLLVALVPLVVLLYLFLLLCAFSRLSGWSRLAAAYPGRARPASPRRWFGYGVFRGWLGYNGGLVVGADERGLDVAGMPILPLADLHSLDGRRRDPAAARGFLQGSRDVTAIGDAGAARGAIAAPLLRISMDA
jgi:hypothetical protein